MLIYVDGPEKAGKTTLIEHIVEGFEPDYVHQVKWTGPDTLQGMGYRRALVDSLMNPTAVHVWDRGWVSEWAYGRLTGEPRKLAVDPFLALYTYDRIAQGRGGRVILLPNSTLTTATLRDETDIDVDPSAEAKMFRQWGLDNNYLVLTNEYDTASLKANSVQCRKSALVGTHGKSIPATYYVGGLRPSMTLIGEDVREWPTTQLPFDSMTFAEYLRPLGAQFMMAAGYASVPSYKRFGRTLPHLFKRPVAVGARAHHAYPELPHVRFVPGEPTERNVAIFNADLQAVAKRYVLSEWLPIPQRSNGHVNLQV